MALTSEARQIKNNNRPANNRFLPDTLVALTSAWLSLMMCPITATRYYPAEVIADSRNAFLDPHASATTGCFIPYEGGDQPALA